MNKIVVLVSILTILILVLFLLYFSLKAEIEGIKKEMEDKSKAYENEHFVILDSINSLYNETNKTRNNIDSLKNRIDELEYQIRRLNVKVSQKGLTNPSMEELEQFIYEDDTDKKEYKNKTFECTEFANTFVKNFAEKGYFSCVAYVLFENSAHAIVAVNTTDYGLVYVEPQADKIIYDLNVNENYCEKLNWACNWKIEKISSCFEVKVG